MYVCVCVCGCHSNALSLSYLPSILCYDAAWEFYVNEFLHEVGVRLYAGLCCMQAVMLGVFQMVHWHAFTKPLF